MEAPLEAATFSRPVSGTVDAAQKFARRSSSNAMLMWAPWLERCIGCASLWLRRSRKDGAGHGRSACCRLKRQRPIAQRVVVLQGLRRDRSATQQEHD
jgi:hypothetical protein